MLAPYSLSAVWKYSRIPAMRLPPPASTMFLRILAWNSGSKRAIICVVASTKAGRMLSQARFMSAVMSWSIGLPSTGISTMICPGGSPTKLYCSFQRRTMFLLKVERG